MRTHSKRASIDVPSRKPYAFAGAPPPARHSVPFGREERHMGAMEEQVCVTMPPKEDDDEPKQG